jgi:hypothetical protein
MAAIPVIIHLLFRPKPKNAPFPTLHFLRKSLKRSRSIMKIKHWLLMLLRVAAVLLLVLIVARPKIVLRGMGAGGKAESSVALLIDDSFPMSFRRSGDSRLQQAQAAAHKILDAYPIATELALFSASGAERTDFLLTPQAIQAGLGALKPSPYAGNLFDTLAQALAALHARSRPNKELFVFTDFTRRAWTGTLRERCPDIPADVRVYLVDVGSEDEENRFIQEIKLAPAHPRENQPLEILVTLGGLTGSADATVALQLDGQTREERHVTTAAGSMPICRFGLPGLAQGHHCGSVMLRGADTIDADNIRHLSVNVERHASVLVVNGDPSSDPRKDECLYLLTALSPPGTRSSAVEVTQLAATSLSASNAMAGGSARRAWEGDFGSYDLVILANTGGLSTETWARLKKYVALGGALVVFGGSRVRTEGYVDGELLPLQITGISAMSSGAALQIADFNQPIVSAFSGGRNGDLMSPRFSQWIQGRPRDGAAVLATFENGDPALVRSSCGRGQVLFAAFTCDADWTDLPKLPCYLPLIHEIVGSMCARRAADYHVAVREELVLPLGRTENPKASLQAWPTGQAHDIPVDVASGQCVLAGLEQPGNYLLTYPPETATASTDSSTSAHATRLALSVNLNSAASVLTRCSPGELQQALAPLDVGLLGSDRKLSGQLREIRDEGREIAPLLALVLLAVLAGEAVLANRFYR